MKRTIYTSLILSLMTANSFAAGSPYHEHQFNHGDKEVAVGFSVGAIAAGIIAGPVALVPGAMMGTFAGKNIADDKKIAWLSDSRDQLRNQLAATQNDLIESNQQLAALEKNMQQQEYVLKDASDTIEVLLAQNHDLKNEILNYSVQFRTASSDIEKQYQAHLDGLANALKIAPDVEIDIAGFADRAGDEHYNQQLSEQRAAKVRAYLVLQGIDERRINVQAFGENQPLHQDESLETNFFDRRATIQMRTPNLVQQKPITGNSIAAN